ncbi:hypothetical protein TNCV_4716751 [Trichonephila clavipes]|nr:hypothetical protein TNCV_4716751 [Trichonephila clavipes]
MGLANKNFHFLHPYLLQFQTEAIPEGFQREKSTLVSSVSISRKPSTCGAYSDYICYAHHVQHSPTPYYGLLHCTTPIAPIRFFEPAIRFQTRKNIRRGVAQAAVSLGLLLLTLCHQRHTRLHAFTKQLQHVPQYDTAEAHNIQKNHLSHICT